MKLQKILKHLQKLHPKEIDLSLDRIKNLCKKLGNPQENLKCISIVGTNGKYSTIQALRSILSESNIICNAYTSPHLQKINERFVYNNKEISDQNLENLLSEVEEINNGEQITFFEILTAAYFYGAKKFPKNINLIESGLFHRFDATNILSKNLSTIITPIGLDHVDWLPSKDRNIDRIIFEKTSNLLNSTIIVSKQDNIEILKKIKQHLSNNGSKKLFFNDLYTYTINENNFFYYEDQYGALNLPMPNLEGNYQLSNISAAIATLRNIRYFKITDKNIRNGVTNIKSIGRFQEIKSGKLKQLIKKNKIYIDGTHNPLGAKVLCEHLKELKCRVHIILGMMANKDHKNYAKYFKDNISSITTIDIPNQVNSIKGKSLKKKLHYFKKISHKKTIQEAISSLDLKEKDIVLVTGSLYLAGEVLNLN
tara:strand:+ start:1345 stop:2616 length:1272 start_codon:yes stop_codon:yes gene_type:complete